jgi:hypothetical protein
MSDSPYAQSEEGNITLLSLGFTIVAILLTLIGAAVTGVHLDRMRLNHVADELALDAADAMNVPAYYAGAAERPTELAGLTVSLQAARDVVETRLPIVQSRCGLGGVEIVEVSSADGHTVTVSVTVVVHPLFGSGGWLPLSDVTLTATSSARVH